MFDIWNYLKLGAKKWDAAFCEPHLGRVNDDYSDDVYFRLSQCIMRLVFNVNKYVDV